MPTYPLTEIEKKAWNFAEKAHYGVFRKFRNATYFDGHVRKVFGLVKQYDTSPEVGAAALLHDCVEDVDDITYEVILKEFGKEIADLVKELTSSEEYIDVMGKPGYLLDKMVTMSKKALIIKLCDRWQNVSDSFSQEESFRDKYYKETRYILAGLKFNRTLNQIHMRIIDQIEGILDNLKSRYYSESRHILMFEDFKQKNITIEDVINCIEVGGVIYAKVINNFIGDPEIPLNPISIDNDGTVTVELNGRNHEVELKNIEKIEYKELNERLYIGSGLDSVINFLYNTKGNKISELLLRLQSYNFYKDEEILNYLGLDKMDNMITYLPTNKRSSGRNSYDENFSNDQRVSIRVGRAIRKIYEEIKPKLNYKKSDSVRIFKGTRSDMYHVDLRKGLNSLASDIILYHPANSTSPTMVKIKGEDFVIHGQVYDISGYWPKFDVINITLPSLVTSSEKNFPSLGSQLNSSEREQYSFDIPVEIEITNSFEITDADIENFVNEYISYVRYSKSDETSTIREVKGSDIRKWYSRNNYQSNMGKLGDSCMSHEDCGAYFDLYVSNPDRISLLILCNKNDKLVGRALLWKLNSGEFFMDRIYTLNDSDDNIFINYAIEKDFLYRNTPAGGFKYFKNSKEVNPGEISVDLDNYDFEYYPYMDTLYCLYRSSLYNKDVDTDKERFRTLKDTDGYWNEYYDDNDPD